MEFYFWRNGHEFVPLTKPGVGTRFLAHETGDIHEIIRISESRAYERPEHNSARFAVETMWVCRASPRVFSPANRSKANHTGDIMLADWAVWSYADSE
jgi:hypothetical protein